MRRPSRCSTRRPSPVGLRATPEFAMTLAAWGTGIGILDAALRARPGGVGELGSGFVASSLVGPLWVVGLLWASALVVALFVHEAGHAVAASRLGALEVKVVLAGLHGRTSYEIDDPWSRQRALIVAAGALAPTMLVPLALVRGGAVFALVGTMLVAVNLLPAPMSDGGHLLAVATHRLVRDPERADALALWLGLSVLGLALVVAVVCQLGWLFVLSAPVFVLGFGVVVARHLPRLVLFAKSVEYGRDDRSLLDRSKRY